jgi:hypothetical protein
LKQRAPQTFTYISLVFLNSIDFSSIPALAYSRTC